MAQTKDYDYYKKTFYNNIKNKYQKRGQQNEEISKESQETPTKKSKNNKESEEDTFESILAEKLLFEDNNIKIEIAPKTFKKSDKFSLEDYLFQLNIETKNQSKPLVLSLLNALSTAFDKLFTVIRNHYYKKNHNNDLIPKHQIRITFLDDSLKSGVNSPNMDLFSSPEYIRNMSLMCLRSYLQSNKTLELNNSFHIDIKILSEKHTNSKVQKGEKFHHWKGFGSKPKNKKRKKALISNIFTYKFPKSIHATETGFVGNLNIWYNKCSIISLIIGNAYNKINENFEEYLPFIEPISIQNGFIINEEVIKITKSLNLSDGPHSYNDIYDMALYYKSQIAIFSLCPLRIEYLSHEKMSPDLPTIYLVAENGNAGYGHLHAIKNFYDFCKEFNQHPCIYCKKVYKFHYKHVCLTFKDDNKFCYSCWRPIYEESYYSNKSIKDLYCHKNKSFNNICFKCNKCLLSEDCVLQHSRHCKRIYKCNSEICQGRLFHRQNILSHICTKQRQCKICKNWCKDLTQHICKVKRMDFQKRWPKLVFAIDYEDSIYLIKEKEKMEHFESEILSLNSYIPSKFHSIISYLPKEMENLDKTISKQGKTIFNGIEVIAENYSEKFNNITSPMQYFLSEILLKDEYKNSTILFKSKEYFPLNLIVKELLLLGITPNVLKMESKIINIKFSDRLLKIIDSEMFFEAKNLNYSSKLIEERMNNLKEYLNMGINFLKEMFKFQMDMSNYSQRAKNMKSDILLRKEKFVKWPLIHPFGDNFCSNTSFIYELFKMHSEFEFYTLKKQETGIQTQCSIGEIKFLQWLNYKYEGKKHYKSARSPFGQKRFKSAIPDGYCEELNEAVFYNGCYYHLHKGCLKIKYSYEEENAIMEQQCIFEEKMNKLRLEVPNIKIKVIYECEFEKLCQDSLLNEENSKLKTFLKEIYIKRNKARLIPRHR